jgi:hypothetical protein
MNLYAYCGGNPIMRTDPLGLMYSFESLTALSLDILKYPPHLLVLSAMLEEIRFTFLVWLWRRVCRFCEQRHQVSHDRCRRGAILSTTHYCS